MQRTTFALFLIGVGFFLGNRAMAQKDEFQPYQQEIPGTDLSFKLVPIPAGSFVMGSPEDEKGHKEDESPQHPVKLDAFWMAEFEMTWDIFESFMNEKEEASETDAVARPTKPYLDMTFGMGKGKHPAVGMTQYGAIQFCKWLYKKTGEFYRLPTEAEWEYACRAGSTKAYAFGSDESRLDEYAWYEDNSGDKTHPAGSKEPNAWGLYDMHGNVMEWTYDQYAPDTYQVFEDTASNPVAEPSELYPHSLRGGSYQSSPAELRSANRIPSQPEWKQIDPQVPKSNWWFPEGPFLGFRVVRPLMPPSEEEIEAYYNKEPIEDF